ncbi:MAG: rhomboid family intramembrane serine protease [Flavobacteriales bacterium]|nr:rhomboid family intramembrane serine protease [Flavobacteriales bacterium]
MIDSVTLLLVILNVLVSLAAFNDRRLFTALLFEPFVIRARGGWHRFITHAFIHANWPHLLVNMFVLYMFGRNVEMLLPMLTPLPATLVFLGLYLGAIVVSSIPAYRRHMHDPNYRAVGASGAVSAVLFAQILMMPTTEVAFLFIPVPMPAWVFGLLYLAYSWYMDKRGGDNVAHDAHFYGAVYGVLYMGLLAPHLVLDIGGFQRTLGI